MIENIKILSNSISVKFKNNHEENFPNIWLRDHAKDEENWDKRSYQRKTFTASLDIGIQIKEAKIKEDGSHLEILWSDMKNVVKKLESFGCKRILLTDRGTQFGYNNLIADMRSIPLMKDYGYPVIFDCTHSVQLPGGNGTFSSGMRNMIPTLSKAAVAAGCDGVFIEVHDNVKDAKSDSATQWPLDRFESLVKKLIEIRRVVK